MKPTASNSTPQTPPAPRSCASTPSSSSPRSWRALARRDDRPAPAELEALALGGGDLPPGRHAGRRLRRHAQVHRQPPPDRDRRRHAGDRPGAAAARRAGHGQELGLASTSRRRSRGDSTLLVQGTAGTSEESIRYGWNYARLLAEGPSRAALVASPLMRAMQDGQDRPRRGADAHPRRRAGHADHDPLGEDAADPRAERARCRRSRASTSSPRPTTATAASTSCRAPSSAASTPWSCRCPTRPRRRSRSSSSASRAWAARWSCPPSRPRWRRSAAS